MGASVAGVGLGVGVGEAFGVGEGTGVGEGLGVGSGVGLGEGCPVGSTLTVRIGTGATDTQGGVVPIGGSVTVTFDEAGEMMIGCHLPGHWDAGMSATFVVA